MTLSSFMVTSAVAGTCLKMPGELPLIVTGSLIVLSGYCHVRESAGVPVSSIFPGREAYPESPQRKVMSFNLWKFLVAEYRHWGGSLFS
jgi:hypothetical protein